MTSELGAMSVTEQLDAMDVLGLDRHQFLVAPRIIAGLVMLPVLSIIAAVVARSLPVLLTTNSLVAGATFDRAKAQALVQQKTDAVRTGSPEVIAAMGDFYDSLNPAQQQQVRDFMQKRRGWRRGG